MTRSDEPNHYSISLRVQRTTVEDAYVVVPVDERVLADEVAGQPRGLDGAKFAERAIEIAARASDWQRESQTVQPHPIQQPMPDGRTAENQEGVAPA